MNNTQKDKLLPILLKLLALILKLLDRCTATKKVWFDFIVGPITTKNRTIHTMELNITNEQKAIITLAPRTAGDSENPDGSPAELDGPARWTQVSGESATLGTVSDDGKTAELISTDTLGDSQFLVEADADLGEGDIEISTLITLHVGGALATNLGATASVVQK